MNKELLLNDVTHVAYALAVKCMQYDQPIAEFDLVRHAVKLEDYKYNDAERLQCSGRLVQ